VTFKFSSEVHFKSSRNRHLKSRYQDQLWDFGIRIGNIGHFFTLYQQ